VSPDVRYNIGQTLDKGRDWRKELDAKLYDRNVAECLVESDSREQ